MNKLINQRNYKAIDKRANKELSKIFKYYGSIEKLLDDYPYQREPGYDEELKPISLIEIGLDDINLKHFRYLNYIEECGGAGNFYACLDPDLYDSKFSDKEIIFDFDDFKKLKEKNNEYKTIK